MTEREEDKTARREVRRKSLRMRAAGFWDILTDAAGNFSLNSDGNQAAAIALYAILSAIPLLILTIIAAGSFFSSNPHIQTDIIGVVQNFHPYASEKIFEQLGHIEGKHKLLGWIGVLGLIWLSAAIFNAMESALNSIFRSRRKRNFFISKLMAFSMIPTAWMIGGLSVFFSYVAALFARQPLVLPGGMEISLTAPAQLLLRFVIPYLMSVAWAVAIYRIIPTVKIRFSAALAGGAAFALLLEVAKQFFTWYVANYTRYNVIFGSLEAVVILVIWVFYVALIFLFCAEMMSSYERRDILLLEQALLEPREASCKTDERLFYRFGRAYPQNSIIFSEGDAGSEMFYILSGRVCLERIDGQVQKTLADMGPGQYFGEMAALIDVRRTAQARALTDCHLAVIDDTTFGHLISESRDVALSMLREFSARLKNSNAALEDFTNLWTRMVVIAYFLDQAQPVMDEHVAGLAGRTGKTAREIRTLIAELTAAGVFIVKDGVMLEVVRDRMWSLLDSGALSKSLPEGRPPKAGSQENRFP